MYPWSLPSALDYGAVPRVVPLMCDSFGAVQSGSAGILRVFRTVYKTNTQLITSKLSRAQTQNGLHRQARQWAGPARATLYVCCWCCLSRLLSLH